MNILLTGGTGFIGSELVLKLLSAGHKLTVVTRNRAAATGKLPSTVSFVEHDLNASPLKETEFENIDAIINLAGESIDRRWTAKNKAAIRNSRILCTQNLLLNCPATVKTLVNASAVGFYGDRGGEELTESSPIGKGFLTDVCEEWEAAAHSFKGRLVILRFGMVISRKGGALKTISELFNKNLGAPLGDGKQWISYISLEDLLNMILFAIENQNVSGTFNAVNNHPVTNLQFSETLAAELNVLLLPTVPRFALKLLLGEMSELLLNSQKVTSSFPYQCKDISIAPLLQRELWRNYR
jgi:uncharacterized protein (TIGR01777 family)